MSTRNRNNEDNGFEEWGGYMAAKKAKLAEQFNQVTCNNIKKQSDVFNGVAIFVNGYTSPSAEELKCIMATHGGTYHHYQMPGTTHIIASILPNAKVKQPGSIPIVKANWISDSLSAHKLLDYHKYLLYTNQDHKQPILDFVAVPKPQTSKTLTAADPGFLSEFYNNSRLHLISTLGAEYKQLVNHLRDKSDGKFPSREKLKLLPASNFTYSETVIMHIDMDCFFVSVGLRAKPHLRGQPVVVTHARNTQAVNRPETSVDAENELWQKHFPGEYPEKLDSHGSMSEIACCSYEARARGVRNGMLLGAALKLCADLKPIPYDFEGYRQVSTVLYNTIASYTLDIEAVSCDEMYVDVTSLLHGITIEQWANHVRNEIMDGTGCPCSTGFGANRLQARLATKKAKPAGQFYLRPHEVDDYMYAIALADLPGVGHATVAKLSKMGLSKCGDLQAVSKAQLQAELGTKIGENVMDLARGIDRKPLNFQHERKSISADVNYGIRFKDKIEALNFLQSLSVEVCSRLQDVGMRARCLNLKLLVRAPDAPKEPAKFLGCGICNTINRSTTTGGLLTDAVGIYKEAKALYERINVDPTELRGVGVQLTRLEKAAPVNSALKRFLQTDNSDPVNKARKEPVVLKRPIQPDKKEAEVVKKLQTKTNRARKNAKSVNKPSNDLNKYLVKQKPVATVSSANVDLDVLNELPEDIRREIIKEYNLEPATPKVKPEVIVETKINKSAFEDLDWEQLKPIILNWLNSTSTPADVDVMMLAEHFKKLAIDRKIEVLKVMFNFLYRHISKLGSCLWHDAYWKMIDIVQEGMVARYGSTLLIERNFCCPLHF